MNVDRGCEENSQTGSIWSRCSLGGYSSIQPNGNIRQVTIPDRGHDIPMANLALSHKVNHDGVHSSGFSRFWCLILKEIPEFGPI